MSPTCSSHRFDEIIMAAVWQSAWQVALLGAATVYFSAKLVCCDRREGLSRFALLSIPLIIFANVTLASHHQLAHSMFLTRLTPLCDMLCVTLAVASVGGLIAWGISFARVETICRRSLSLDALDRTKLRRLMWGTDDSSLRLVLTHDTNVRAPFVWGLRHSRIVMPAALWQRWTDYELRLLLLHELKHIHRRDAGWNLALTLVASVLWWLPTVRWLLRDNRLQRELVCDQSVLKLEPSPRRYAQLLRCLAKEDRYRIASPPSVLSSDLTHRVAVLLGRKPKRLPLHGWLGAAITATILALPHISVALGGIDSRTIGDTRSVFPDDAKTEPTDFAASLQTGNSEPPASQVTVRAAYCCSR